MLRKPNQIVINAIVQLMRKQERYKEPAEKFFSDICKIDARLERHSPMSIVTLALCEIRELLPQPHRLLVSSDPSCRYISIIHVDAVCGKPRDEAAGVSATTNGDE